MSMFERQNDSHAVKYLRAAHYCYKKERLIEMVMTVVSILIFFAGVMSKYLIKIFPEGDPGVYLKISQAIMVFSGVFLITQIAVNRYLRNLHFTGVNIQERYDCMVYGIPENKVIMKQIFDSDVENYSRKMHSRSLNYKFVNHYFASPEAASAKGAIYESQHKVLLTDYKILTYVRASYYVIWVGFIAAIFLLAVITDDNFVVSLINILIPSLSTISLILNSQHSFQLSANKLQNALNAMAKQKTDEINESSASVLRGIQDGLFWYRCNSFNVSYFLVKRYEKYEKKMITAAEARTRLEKEKAQEIKAIEQRDAREAKEAYAAQVAATKAEAAQETPKPAAPKPAAPRAVTPKPAVQETKPATVAAAPKPAATKPAAPRATATTKSVAANPSAANKSKTAAVKTVPATTVKKTTQK